ncbi:cytoplasmic dynein 2 intermediate chain 1 [Chrysoperla carnea]|uniref:cytoplasmic dynein 2 intermediate chain 1 n=1 Tax=Chrysoperla carnea TaxID=189513 RepID=UPI001D07457B|nr:cytoplasmic dynein 2 intermediate chain 1 [Chrysoperla carnea]
MKQSTSVKRTVKKSLVDDKEVVKRSLSRERSQIKVNDKTGTSKDSKSRLIRNSSNVGTKSSALSNPTSKNVQKTVTSTLKSRPTALQLSNIKKIENERQIKELKKQSSTSRQTMHKTSSRVTTTKYIPAKTSSKQNSFIKNDTKPPDSTRRDRTVKNTSDKIVKPIRSKSRTLSPSEVKILRNPSQTDDTVKVPQSKPTPIKKDYTPEVKAHESPPSEDYNYEDDFDSYESDFEQYSSSHSSSSSSTSDEKLDIGSISSSSSSESEEDMPDKTKEIIISKQLHVEEEKKMDSGNYDLRESKRTKTLNGIKEAIERENSYVKNIQDTSFSDEGFDEKPVRLEKQIQNSKKMRKRGEDILSMITLDTLSANLLEMLPIPYEMYMLNYGRGETQQIYSQTNDEDLSEEVQTDEIEMKNMWTQNPTEYCGKIKTIEDILECNYFLNGVGGDSVVRAEQKIVNMEKLNIFLRSTSDVVLRLLSNKNTVEACTKATLPFSIGYKALNTSLQFLINRPMRILEYSRSSNIFILTVHDSNLNEFMPEDQQLFARSLICIWDLLDISIPSKLLISNDNVTAACFEYSKTNLIFGGLQNGGISVWDLSEHVSYHKTVKDELDNIWTLRTPTFVKEPEDCKDLVLDEVVAIKSIANDEKSLYGQVCSLNKRGQLVIWIVITSNLSEGQVQLVQGLAYWGRIRLSPSISVNVNNFLNCTSTDLECYDLQIDSKDPNHLYISTNYGFVVHCLTLGTKVTPKLYESNTGYNSPTTCVEPCPFNQPYFLVGCTDGSIRLHSRYASKSLTTLLGVEDNLKENSIKLIQWLKSKPFCIFSLDVNNTLHIWNLENSDIYPIYSIPFKEKISTIKVLPIQNDRKTHLVMGYENGKIELHEMNEEYAFKTMDHVANNNIDPEIKNETSPEINDSGKINKEAN